MCLQGGVTFAALTSSLSWSEITSDAVWVVRGCFFGSMVFSISATVLGMQRASLMSPLSIAAQQMQGRGYVGGQLPFRVRPVLKYQTKAFWINPEKNMPRLHVLFTWQAPMILLNFSWMLFGIGLATHLTWPVVQNGFVGDDAKVCRPVQADFTRS